MDKRILTSDYKREFPEPMILREGDRIEIKGKGDQYPQWYYCISEEGIESYVPDNILVINGTEATVTEDYNSWELSGLEGETVSVHREFDGWAFCSNSRGENGWLPLEILA